MLDREVLDKNFRFLVLEVVKQVESAVGALDHVDAGEIKRMKSRDDYIDHLKSIIENGCFTVLGHHADLDKRTVHSIRSINVIAANLENIADHAVSIVRQASHFSEPTFMHRYDYRAFFDKVFAALAILRQGSNRFETNQAVAICRTELELDDLYKTKFERILAEMVAGVEIPNLVTSLFIFHYLERMGDALENIGEAILSAKVGEKLKFHQFQSLRGALAQTGKSSDPTADVDFQGIWGTRSGCRIGKVSDQAAETNVERDVVFKEGDLQKITDEKNNIEKWDKILPGLPPHLVEFQVSDRDASILVEYLQGSTLQEIALHSDMQVIDRVCSAVQETLAHAWHASKETVEIKPHFFSQLLKRLDDVYRVHPYFKGIRKQIGGLSILSFDEQLRACLPLDDELVAPFRVFAHGDFNIDNIIFNPDENKVHFVDLHRSGQTDYVQDISVLLISCFRVAVFDQAVRRRLSRVSASFLEFARGVAEDNQDTTFDARLAAGLARSFATSTRFEIDREFAENMLQRSAYLLRRLSGHRHAGWERFNFPTELLFD